MPGIAFRTKSFGELTSTELYAILKLRAEVFVVEQTCPYLDPDGKDEEAFHVMGYEGTELAAYARILKPGVSYTEAAIGRVVVAPNQRGKKYGEQVMKESMAFAFKQFSTNVIIISAQQYLEKFYNGLGFVTKGEMYLEDDIPHIKMKLEV